MVLAISLISAAFASPSLAAARTRTFSTLRPSASCSIPSTASRPPFGVSRTVSVMPSGVTIQGLAAAGVPLPPALPTK